MEVDANGDGLSRDHECFPFVRPESGLVELRLFHKFAGVSPNTVKLWVQDGMPVLRHRMKHGEVRIIRWIEFMERYDKQLPPAEPPATRKRKPKGGADGK